MREQNSIRTWDYPAVVSRILKMFPKFPLSWLFNQNTNLGTVLKKPGRLN